MTVAPDVLSPEFASDPRAPKSLKLRFSPAV